MNEKEIDISQKQHAEVIRQMRIGNIAAGIIATASLFTLVTIFIKVMK